MLRHKKGWGIVAGVLGGVVGAVACGLWLRSRGQPPAPERFTLGADTTCISAPLNADGTVNYTAVLNQRLSEGVTLENNAVLPLLEVLGPSVVPAAQRARFCGLLGIAELPRATNRFMGFDEYCVATTVPAAYRGGTSAAEEARSKVLRLAEQAPWRAGDYPELAGWLKANAPALAAARRAAERPKSFWPLVSPYEPDVLAETFGIPYGEVRGIVEALLARSMLSAAENDVGAAVTDVRNARRLGRVLLTDPRRETQLVGLAISRRAGSAAVALAARGLLSPAQAEDLLAEIVAEDPVCDAVGTIDCWERYSQLDGVMLCKRIGFPKGMGLLLHGAPPTWAPKAEAIAARETDWNRIMRADNAWIDRFVAAARKATYHERQEELKLAEKEFEKHGVPLSTVPPRGDPSDFQRLGEVIFFCMASRAQPHLSALIDEGEMEHRLDAVALALTVYRARHGAYPDTLTALCPECLSQIPQDIFVDAPPHYRRDGEGFVLYSVGPDGRDDGGVAKESDPKANDIVIRCPATRDEQPR